MWRGRLNQFSELPVTEASELKIAQERINLTSPFYFLCVVNILLTPYYSFAPLVQMATYAGFVAEVYAWFAIGEIIGRGGTLSGYSI